MVKRQIVVILEDSEPGSSERYLDILAEELQDILADKRLSVISVNEKSDSEKSPKS